MRRVAGVVAAFTVAVAGVIAVPSAAIAVDVGPWQYNPATGHYYRLVDNVTWEQGETYAVSVGGHLVTVNDQAEQDWLEVTFTGQGLWIGFNDRALEGTWVWVSGEPVTYTHWIVGEEPNNCTWCGDPPHPEGEDVAVLWYTSPATGVEGWNDVGEWGGAAIVEVTTLPRGPVGGRVGGVYHYWVFDDPTPARGRQVTVSAVGTDPLNGQWSLTWPDTKASVSGDVTCLVVDGDQAWVAGRITRIRKTAPELLGEGIFLWVRDSAPGVPDRAYSWIGDPGQTLAEMEGWCLGKNVNMPDGFADGFTVDRGTVTVWPG